MLTLYELSCVSNYLQTLMLIKKVKETRKLLKIDKKYCLACKTRTFIKSSKTNRDFKRMNTKFYK